jgi:hypothetical protein
LELSGGTGMGYPQVLTARHNMINAGELSAGLGTGICYKPKETRFFPSLNISLHRERLPLQVSGNNIAALRFNCLDISLNENYTVTFSKSQLLIYAGIGLSRLTEKGVAPSGNETTQTTIDSTANISTLFPALNIGFEYNPNENTDNTLYMSIGINFQYSFLYEERNNYYITVAEPGNNTYHYQSGLSGSIICPNLYIVLHYKVHKKKSSMYLE